MKLSPKAIEALIELRGNSSFEKVMEAMLEHETEERQRCVDHEGSAQLRAAGAVKALALWRESFDGAPALLNKLRNQK